MKVFVNVSPQTRASLRKDLQEKVGALHSFDVDTFDRAAIEQLLAGADMFGNTAGVVLSGVLEDKSTKDEVLELLSDAASDAPLLLFEYSLPAEVKKQLKKMGVEVDEHKEKKAEGFNVFGLTEAVAQRNKKLAWLKFQEAVSLGESSDYLLSMIAWQVRNILIASRVPEKESGMKPFVYRKSKGAAARYHQRELEEISRQCVDLQSRSRETDGTQINVLVERLLLSL